MSIMLFLTKLFHLIYENISNWFGFVLNKNERNNLGIIVLDLVKITQTDIIINDSKCLLSILQFNSA